MGTTPLSPSLTLPGLAKFRQRLPKRFQKARYNVGVCICACTRTVESEQNSRHGSSQALVPELSGTILGEWTSIRCIRFTAVHRHFDERCGLDGIATYCTCRGLACGSPTVVACGEPLMHHAPRKPGLGCGPHVLSSPTLVRKLQMSNSSSRTALLAVELQMVSVFRFQNMHGTRLAQWSHGSI